ncbi:MAG: hypothetical protein QNJ34_13320 [Xenococcaceae cyanobacterium MO_188.B29]|nr:hypothetical protein [Xenococcaceae cyanobacterium MO_188.B29]
MDLIYLIPDLFKFYRLNCQKRKNLVNFWTGERICNKYSPFSRPDSLYKAIANRAKIDAVEPRAKQVLFEDGRITLHFDHNAIFSFLLDCCDLNSAIAISSTHQAGTSLRCLANNRENTSDAD